MPNKKIAIGIPCFQSAPAETLEDYMRFAFYLRRKYQEYDFYLAIKPKSEQFRARNSIVEAALQGGCDYLLMLDDDHVINWQDQDANDPGETQVPYEFLRILLEDMKKTKAGMVGALYYHRGGECRPVIMKEGKNGGYFYMRDDEITGELQEVAVTGGGCMLLDMNIFSRIGPSPFEPEFQFGTDIQICEKTRKEGFKVYCNTGIVLGHVLSKREVVTPKNRQRLYAESVGKTQSPQEGMDPQWNTESGLRLYRMDVEEYLKMPFEKFDKLALEYQKKYDRFNEFDNPADYYKALGPEQLARQAWYHHQPWMVEQFDALMKLFNNNQSFKGMEYGCGSSPVGFELALKGHDMTLIDLPGTPAYEFTKWRAEKRNKNISFNWNGGGYDFILFLDSIEHLSNWKEILTKAGTSLNQNGFIVTNFFLNQDYENVEHINMDKNAVRNHLRELGFYQIERSKNVWD
jgi:2-polyprenyl-3-methyl-5-hydroxy-6-metoxy-1,4-benzoquinol methylase